MSRTLKRVRALSRLFVLAVYASGVCRADDSAGCVPKGFPYVASESDEDSCGEERECLTTKYKLLDCHEMFQCVAGDEPLLKCLKSLDRLRLLRHHSRSASDRRCASCPQR